VNSYFNRKELIYAVYQEKSISKAAQKLFVSQPSLSIMIRKIEEEIGTPLFDRTSKPIRMTQVGMEYIRAAEAIMHIETSFESYISDFNDLLTGTLTIGGNQLLSSLVLPKYISEFISRYPNIDLHLVDDNSLALENLISAGKLDLVIDNRKLDPQIFEQRLLKQEHLLLAVPAGFACNQGLEEYQLREEDILSGAYLSPAVRPAPPEHFQDIPFISMTKDNDTRRCSDEILRQLGIVPNMILEIDRLVTLYNFIEIGTAASVVSDTLVRHIQHHSGRVVFYRLDSTQARREIYVSRKRNKYCSKAMKAFVDLIFSMDEARSEEKTPAGPELGCK